MTFAAFPAAACWRHRGARSGFEVAYFRAAAGGWSIDGTTTAVEDGQTWIVSYRIRLDAAWLTREAHVTARTAAGLRQSGLTADGAGRRRVDGRPAPRLDGCLDIDPESSALTNTLPGRTRCRCTAWPWPPERAPRRPPPTSARSTCVPNG